MFTQECCRILNLKLLRYFCVYPVAEVPSVSQKLMVANVMAFSKRGGSWGNGGGYVSGSSVSAPGALLGRGSWRPQAGGSDPRAWASVKKNESTEDMAKHSFLEKS